MAACSSRVTDQTQTRSRYPRFSSLTAQDVQRFRFVKLYGVLERGRANLRVELGRLDARMAEQAADLLQVVVLLVDLHRHTVAKVVRLQHRVADQAAVRLAEPPDVLAFHRPSDDAF